MFSILFLLVPSARNIFLDGESSPGSPAKVLIRERFSDTSAETTRLNGATHPSLTPYPTISFDEENDSLSLVNDVERVPPSKH